MNVASPQVKDVPATRVVRSGAGRFVPQRQLTGTDAIQFTTGGVAKIIGVSPRTVQKWVDSGRLVAWRLPESQDRRILAHELLAFLEATGSFVPAELRVMVCGRPELVLYRCPSAVAVAVAGATADADITVVESPWELAKLFARPHVGGVIVCGDGAARSEIEDVFRHRPAGWLRIHVRGPDQEPAVGADVSMAGDDLGGLLPAVARHLIGGR